MYDFQDFVDCVNDKGAVILMHPEDFIDFQNEKRSAKDVHCHLIADISEAQFRRNETKIFWKSSFAGQDYKESEFLKLKFRKQCKNRVSCFRKGGARGINAATRNWYHCWTRTAWDFG